ncbi:MAG: hypothetical protein M1308_11355 [Actinobacteria bacterium]|nr:hypothetical protein [Actinomycetota bacterium]
MIKEAAQGDIIYNDDTVAKILSRINIADDKREGRKGIFTSGFLSVAEKTNKNCPVFYRAQS